MSGATMQIALYNVDTEERTMLVGLTRAQLVRFEVEPGHAHDLKARLDELGHLPVWECRRLADDRVELVQPMILNAGAVLTFVPAPDSILLLAA